MHYCLPPSLETHRRSLHDHVRVVRCHPHALVVRRVPNAPALTMLKSYLPADGIDAATTSPTETSAGPRFMNSYHPRTVPLLELSGHDTLPWCFAAPRPRPTRGSTHAAEAHVPVPADTPAAPCHCSHSFARPAVLEPLLDQVRAFAQRCARDAATFIQPQREEVKHDHLSEDGSLNKPVVIRRRVYAVDASVLCQLPPAADIPPRRLRSG